MTDSECPYCDSMVDVTDLENNTEVKCPMCETVLEFVGTALFEME